MYFAILAGCYLQNIYSCILTCSKPVQNISLNMASYLCTELQANYFRFSLLISILFYLLKEFPFLSWVWRLSFSFPFSWTIYFSNYRWIDRSLFSTCDRPHEFPVINIIDHRYPLLQHGGLKRNSITLKRMNRTHKFQNNIEKIETGKDYCMVLYRNQ